LEANFVYHENDGQPLVSGSVNWAKEGRSFKIEPCNKFATDDKDCFVWSEVDSRHWYVKPLKNYPLKYSFLKISTCLNKG